MAKTAKKADDDEKVRRDWGAGGVSYDKKRDRWCGTIEAGITARGTRRRIKVYGRTEPAAKRALRNKKDEIARTGIPAEGMNQNATVKGWAKQWLEIAKGRLRPNAYTATLAAVNLWIVPTIGHKRLSMLTPADIRAVTKAILAAGRSSSTANRYHGDLIKMLRDALVEGYDIKPRLLELDPPARAISDRDAITPAQLMQVIEAATAVPAGIRWITAILQGMRQGECLGLTWNCVDLDAATIDISWQLQEVPFEHGCGDTCGYKRPGSCPSRKYRIPLGFELRPLVGRLCLTRPKTSAGQRIVPLVPWMVAALRLWREQAPPSPHDLVWPENDGQPRDEKEDRAAWYALQKRLGVTHGKRPYVIHETRHTAATLLLEADVDPHTVTAIMGHTDIATSRGYQHADQTLTRRAMEKVAERLQLVPVRT